MEQKALQLKQLEDTIYKQQLQKNELAQAHTEEMLKLTKVRYFLAFHSKQSRSLFFFHVADLLYVLTHATSF